MNLKPLFISCLFAFIAIIGKAQVSNRQALFIYNFTRYIEWPTENQESLFVIGVIGSDSEIASELQSITSQKKVGSRTIEVNVYRNAKEIKSCQILFVPHEKMGDFANIAAKVKSSPTLLITEEASIPSGSIINFVIEGSKLKYEVDLELGKAKGLKISEKLVAVGK